MKLLKAGRLAHPLTPSIAHPGRYFGVLEAFNPYQFLYLHITIPDSHVSTSLQIYLIPTSSLG